MTTLQVPNKELVATLVAAGVGTFTTGWVESGAGAVFYLAGATWAYQEITDGANWLRRGLGLAFAAYLLVSLAMRLHAH